jgi:hypothetical protein
MMGVYDDGGSAGALKFLNGSIQNGLPGYRKKRFWGMGRKW